MAKQLVQDNPFTTEAIVQIFLVKEGSYWCAIAPALRSSGYGKTEEEAKSSLKIEMDLMFEEAREKGSLERLLISYGWTLSQHMALPPQTAFPVELLSKPQSPISSYQERVVLRAA